MPGVVQCSKRSLAPADTPVPAGPGRLPRPGSFYSITIALIGGKEIA